MEVLVAMMVLALSLTVIMQLFSGGLRAERMSGDYLQAIYLAREKMEEILLEKRMRAGVAQGKLPNGYEWKTEISLAEPEVKTDENRFFTPAEKKDLVLFRIDMDISWPQGREKKHYTLSTLHLAGRIEEDHVE
ncbi:MAG: hypothetical protein HY885_06495 [Deltaproteobacteria bacterium]|nr:hypothetical protein [Deltaproteobacteria bacterium]